jgi:hypothetical protein
MPKSGMMLELYAHAMTDPRWRTTPLFRCFRQLQVPSEAKSDRYCPSSYKLHLQNIEAEFLLDDPCSLRWLRMKLATRNSRLGSNLKVNKHT